MNTGFRVGPLACALAMVVAASGCATQPHPERTIPVQPSQPAQPVALPGVMLQQPRPGLYTAGQPAAGDWARLPGLGIVTVINLRPPEELQDRDEAAEVRAAGLAYVNIPIAGPDAVTPANARALQDAIAAARGKVLVHCSSGNRAGALLALAARAQGMTAQQALDFGKAAGLAGLEPVVRARLELPVAACKPGDSASRC